MANLQHGKLFSFSFPLQLCISSGMYVCMYVYLYYKTVLADMIEKKWQFFRLLIQLFTDFNSKASFGSQIYVYAQQFLCNTTLP